VDPEVRRAARWPRLRPAGCAGARVVGRGLSGVEGSGGPPAGWYPDPAGRPVARWWDGGAWTDHLAPLDGSPPAAPTPPSAGRTILLVLAIIVGSLGAIAAVLSLLVGACFALFYGLGSV
jgi:hypothetical protein